MKTLLRYMSVIRVTVVISITAIAFLTPVVLITMYRMHNPRELYHFNMPLNTTVVRVNDFSEWAQDLAPVTMSHDAFMEAFGRSTATLVITPLKLLLVKQEGRVVFVDDIDTAGWKALHYIGHGDYYIERGDVYWAIFFGLLAGAACAAIVGTILDGFCTKLEGLVRSTSKLIQSMASGTRNA